jgi:hypothetical protein
MQEVWDLFALEELSEPNDTEATDQILLALSHDAQMGSNSVRTIQFQGTVHGKPVVVLVDSGSSSSFLAASVVEQLPHLRRIPVTASVKIANGQILRCTASVPDCSFVLAGHHFQHDLKILHLDSYDIILGMDWLEKYSPMHIHWKAKWISLPYFDSTIILQGMTTSVDTDLIFQLISEDTPVFSEGSQPLPP